LGFVFRPSPGPSSGDSRGFWPVLASGTVFPFFGRGKKAAKTGNLLFLIPTENGGRGYLLLGKKPKRPRLKKGGPCRLSFLGGAPGTNRSKGQKTGFFELTGGTVSRGDRFWACLVFWASIGYGPTNPRALTFALGGTELFQGAGNKISEWGGHPTARGQRFLRGEKKLGGPPWGRFIRGVGNNNGRRGPFTQSKIPTHLRRLFILGPLCKAPTPDSKNPRQRGERIGRAHPKAQGGGTRPGAFVGKRKGRGGGISEGCPLGKGGKQPLARGRQNLKKGGNFL